MWTRVFSTAIIPVLLLILLNARIIWDLASSNGVQRIGAFRRQRKEINTSFVLLCIVLIFFCCHALRIVLDIHEFSNVENIIRCKLWLPGYWMQALVYVSHTTMILNSSVNFIVYCLVGHTFRKEMCRTFGVRKVILRILVPLVGSHLDFLSNVLGFFFSTPQFPGVRTNSAALGQNSLEKPPTSTNLTKCQPKSRQKMAEPFSQSPLGVPAQWNAV